MSTFEQSGAKGRNVSVSGMEFKIGFNGKYLHNLDKKGRIFIPSKHVETFKMDFRDSEGFVLAKGPEKCIEAYPYKEWAKYMEQISSFPQFAKKARKMRRYIQSNSVNVVPDKQNRIALPQDLAEFAGVEFGSKVLICGNYDKLEFWNEDVWKSLDAETGQEFEDLAEQIAEMEFQIKGYNPFPGQNS